MSARPENQSPSRIPRPDPLPLRVAHRAIRRDLSRLTDLANDLAGRRQRLDARRAGALVRYLDLFAESVHHHHTLEDDLLWPVLTAEAGAALDLAELEDDHGALDPEFQRVRDAARALQADPDSSDAALALADRLAGLQQLLEEHMGEEDAVVLPAIEAHLSVEQWAAIERKAARSGARMSFELPRVLDVVTPAEFAQLVAATNRVVLGVARLLTMPRYRRLERAVFGTGAAGGPAAASSSAS